MICRVVGVADPGQHAAGVESVAQVVLRAVVRARPLHVLVIGLIHIVLPGPGPVDSNTA